MSDDPTVDGLSPSVDPTHGVPYPDPEPDASPLDAAEEAAPEP